MIDCNEWRTEKRHGCANMGKVKRLKLWWQLYRTSLPVWDLENFRLMDFCWQKCTLKLLFLKSLVCQLAKSVYWHNLLPSCAQTEFFAAVKSHFLPEMKLMLWIPTVLFTNRSSWHCQWGRRTLKRLFWTWSSTLCHPCTSGITFMQPRWSAEALQSYCSLRRKLLCWRWAVGLDWLDCTCQR